MDRPRVVAQEADAHRGLAAKRVHADERHLPCPPAVLPGDDDVPKLGLADVALGRSDDGRGILGRDQTDHGHAVAALVKPDFPDEGESDYDEQNDENDQKRLLTHALTSTKGI